MATPLLTITDTGRAALVAANNAGTNQRRVTAIGLSTTAFTVSTALTTLPHEHKRIDTFAGENIARDTLHVTLRDDTTDQFTLYGFGLYLDDGVLLAVYCQDTPIMEKSPAAILLLSADLQFTSLNAAKLTFADASFTNPPATTERHGVVELATQSEVDEGWDDTRVVTAKTAATRYAALAGASFTGGISALLVDTDTVFSKFLSVDAGASIGHGIWLTGARHALFSVERFDGFSIEAFGSVLPDGPVKPIALAPHGGHVLVGTTVDDGQSALQVAGIATAATPDIADRSTKLATTEWVRTVISSASVGQIIMEPRLSARAGFLKLNGAILRRDQYPELWAYAATSGLMKSEAEWLAGNIGCFSDGDGVSTFRLPELRGEFLRCADDGRGADPGRATGSWQDSANRTHAHGAQSEAVGDHGHEAWTDTQGWHGHHGDTASVGDHQHIVPWGEKPGIGAPPWGTWGDRLRGAGSNDTDNTWYLTSPAGGHAHSFDTWGAGQHGHAVGMNGAGAHSHPISVNADGGAESRPRNVALLAVICAY
ncbi:MAG: phage tail protein [Janthinobacterium lividum]